ncbi:DOMON-like domain-containing protein [Ferribacterium limneticum]|uniref:DOMON-like domain-containing protein n=1 Tax=Ferribacterium limneticum TaxID=76259 RepID=UPI001CFA8465|nr:DOMON-like domain-containing protein [Ferribacterium limneticum]
MTPAPALSAPTIATLLSHPAALSAQPCGIEVTAAMTADGDLTLDYRVTCPPSALRLPAPQPPGPADGLWQHTCCEAFVAEADAGYREFNFSPSGQWAAYRFTGYRERDEAFAPTAEPQLSFTPLADGFALRASLPAALLPTGNTLHLGLTAVIEAADGSKSYWALAHCAAQPDFHVRQSFALTLKRNTP